MIDTDEEDEFNNEQDDLLTHLQRIVNRNCCVCFPNVDQVVSQILAQLLYTVMDTSNNYYSRSW